MVLLFRIENLEFRMKKYGLFFSILHSQFLIHSASRAGRSRFGLGRRQLLQTQFGTFNFELKAHQQVFDALAIRIARRFQAHNAFFQIVNLTQQLAEIGSLLRAETSKFPFEIGELFALMIQIGFYR